MGDTELVERVLKADEERWERRYALQANGYDFDTVVAQGAKALDMDVGTVLGRGKDPRRSRPEVCFAPGPIGNRE